MAKTEVERILDQMDRAFAGDAWHGPSLQSLLEGITARVAAKYPVAGAHSVWELVHHIAAWNSIVCERTLGRTVEVTPAQDWPPIPDKTEVAWRQSLENLRAARTALRNAVTTLNDDDLRRKAAGEIYSIGFMLDGLIQHDLYHAGQIAVLKKGVAVERGTGA